MAALDRYYSIIVEPLYNGHDGTSEIVPNMEVKQYTEISMSEISVLNIGGPCMVRERFH